MLLGLQGGFGEVETLSQPVALRVSGDPDTGNNGLFHLHTDHLGSVSVVSKYADGYIRGDTRAFYEPFGAFRLEPSAGLTDRGFTGHRHNNLSGDVDVGLIYMNARFYVPGIGRFASADTVVPEPGDPQSLNRFAYALNNPVKYRDPTGHYVANVNEAGACNITNACDIDGHIVDAHRDAEEIAQNRQTAGEVAGTALSVFCELCDWYFAATDGLQWYDTVGLLPIVPAAVGDDIGKTAARFIPAGWSNEAGQAIGHWVDLPTSDLGKDWAQYQAYVTGVEGMEFKFNGVRFDGVVGVVDTSNQIDNLTLLDAKFWDSGPDSLAVNLGEPWAEMSILGQVRGQLRAVAGTGVSIQWHVADGRAAALLKQFLDRYEVAGINVIETPWQP